MVTFAICVVSFWLYAGYSGWQSAVENPNPFPKAIALVHVDKCNCIPCRWYYE